MAPSRMDPVTEHLLSRVTWEWQDLEPIVVECISKVTPGKALRAYEARKEQRRRGGEQESLHRRLTDDEKIVSGARSIVNDRLAAQRNSGRIEIQGDRYSHRTIRLRERRAAGHSTPAAPAPVPQSQDQGEPMFGNGEAKSVAETAMRQVNDLYAAWGMLQASLKEWKDEILSEVREVKRRQTEQANIVRGQVESLHTRIDALDITSTEVLESEINDLRVSVNALRETVRQQSEQTKAMSEAQVRLVARMSGALSANEVFPEGRRGH